MYLTECILPILIAFTITIALGPILIPWLRKLKVGNTEREELKSHQVKNGTPTMGGVMIIAGVLVALAVSYGYSAITVNDYSEELKVPFSASVFFAVGQERALPRNSLNASISFNSRLNHGSYVSAW